LKGDGEGGMNIIEVLYTHIWNQWKLSKLFKRGRGNSEFDQSTLYACMEMSQWKTFVQLTYTNKRVFGETLNKETNRDTLKGCGILER
jgi:hypothetical protein